MPGGRARAQSRSPVTIVVTDETGARPSEVFPAGACTVQQATAHLLAVIVGLGFLALPWCFARAGWVCGTALLAAVALMMSRTARVLVDSLRDDSDAARLGTFPDLADFTFGAWARRTVSALFVSEMIGSAVAAVVLASDNLSVLAAARLPWLRGTPGKIALGFVAWLSTFLDLSTLSATSLFGIVSSACLVCAVFFDGFSKPTAPGSLWETAETSLWPTSPHAAMVSGIFVSCLSCHGVLPGIYLGMRDRKRIDTVINSTFFIAFVLYFILAAAGYLMFGIDAFDIITENLATPGFPNPILNKGLAALMVVIPLAKFPLLIDAVAVAVQAPAWSAIPAGLREFCERHRHGDDADRQPPDTEAEGRSRPAPAAGEEETTRLLRPDVVEDLPGKAFGRVLRTALVVLVLTIAVAFPFFSNVLSLVGALLTCSMSIIFPSACHLKLKAHRMSSWSRGADGVTIALGLLLAISGTVSSITAALSKRKV